MYDYSLDYVVFLFGKQISSLLDVIVLEEKKPKQAQKEEKGEDVLS